MSAGIFDSEHILISTEERNEKNTECFCDSFYPDSYLSGIDLGAAGRKIRQGTKGSKRCIADGKLK